MSVCIRRLCFTATKPHVSRRTSSHRLALRLAPSRAEGVDGPSIQVPSLARFTDVGGLLVAHVLV